MRQMSYSLALLGPVVSAARATMLDLDPRDVPQNLHKIAVQTGKKLPPPMARRVLEELDMNEWFRDKVAEQLGDRLEADDAARLFLVRPDGWEAQFAELTSEGEAAEQASETDHLRLRVGALEKELDAARNKMKRAQR